MGPGRAGYEGNIFLRLATVASQLGNVVLYSGSPDETISGRCYRQGYLLGNPLWLHRAIQLDRLFGASHCRDSHTADVAFAREIIRIHQATHLEASNGNR